MKEKAKKQSTEPQSQFNLKDGKAHQLGRSARNLEMYAERRARKAAARGTLSFSSGK